MMGPQDVRLPRKTMGVARESAEIQSLRDQREYRRRETRSAGESVGFQKGSQRPPSGNEFSSVHGRQLSHIDMLLEGGVMTTLVERI
jgi:hypothetical protein